MGLIDALMVSMIHVTCGGTLAEQGGQSLAVEVAAVALRQLPRSPSGVALRQVP